MPRRGEPPSAPSVARSEKKAHPFYSSLPWIKLRGQALRRDYGRPCKLCGKPVMKGQALQVDHIQPRALRPDLAMDLRNLRSVHTACHSIHTHTTAPAVRADGLPADGSWD